MKTLTLYFTPNRKKNRNIIIAGKGRNRRVVGAIRVVESNDDLLTALDNAKPREGEVVLNTIEVE